VQHQEKKPTRGVEIVLGDRGGGLKFGKQQAYVGRTGLEADMVEHNVAIPVESAMPSVPKRISIRPLY